MKRTLIVAASLAAALSTAAFAQGYGMGPGMMGGYGGYGPGAGMGPGMMGGYGGYGPGSGMGMGMCPGMMGGYGPGSGMGPGRGGYGIPDLTTEQRARLADIQKEFRNRQWALMQSMNELEWNQADVYRDGKFDDQAARKAFDARADLRKQMFENSLDMRKGVDGVLTPQQREQLSQRLSAGVPCPGGPR